MMKLKERIKIIFFNSVITYIFGFFIYFVTYILFKSKLMHSNFYISMFITPAVFSFFSSLQIWFSTNYEVIKLNYNSENNLKKIADFSNSNRIKKIKSKGNVEIYKIYTLYSFFSIKLKIKRTESYCIITAPKSIIKELLGKEFLAKWNKK